MSTSLYASHSFRQTAFTRWLCFGWAALLCFQGLLPPDGKEPRPIPAPLPVGVGFIALPSKRRRRESPAEASADYGRFSTEMQDETTIESQQETCRQEAVRHGQPIDPRLEYVDRAVSGTKLHREGLDRLLDDAEAGRFNRLYFYSLSRLARESIIGMPILKRLV